MATKKKSTKAANAVKKASQVVEKKVNNPSNAFSGSRAFRRR